MLTTGILIAGKISTGVRSNITGATRNSSRAQHDKRVGSIEGESDNPHSNPFAPRSCEGGIPRQGNLTCIKHAVGHAGIYLESGMYPAQPFDCCRPARQVLSCKDHWESLPRVQFGQQMNPSFERLGKNLSTEGHSFRACVRTPFPNSSRRDGWK